MMNLFLAQVAEDFADYFIVMQVGLCRMAPGQRAAGGRRICGWSFNPPIVQKSTRSNLWEELREKYLHNRVFPSLEDLLEVLCQALSELTEDKERLRSMMFFPHFRVES
jgi:hypothetical protein